MSSSASPAFQTRLSGDFAAATRPRDFASLLSSEPLGSHYMDRVTSAPGSLAEHAATSNAAVPLRRGNSLGKDQCPPLISTHSSRNRRSRTSERSGLLPQTIPSLVRQWEEVDSTSQATTPSTSNAIRKESSPGGRLLICVRVGGKELPRIPRSRTLPRGATAPSKPPCSPPSSCEAVSAADLLSDDWLSGGYPGSLHDATIGRPCGESTSTVRSQGSGASSAHSCSNEAARWPRRKSLTAPILPVVME